MIKLLIGYFGWWYSEGFLKLLKFFRVYLVHLTNNFSVKPILKTFFSQWKKSVATKGRGIEAIGDWIVENLISRTIGIIVRTIVLLAYMITVLIYFVAVIAILFSWLLMPAIMLLVLLLALGNF